MNNILEKLKGGDLRSVGRSDEVVEDILKKPSLFREVFEGIFNDDPRVKMRSADALEKVSSARPKYLQPFKNKLINEVSKIEQQEVQWHTAQMFSYLKVNKKERDVVIKILLNYINTSKSNIVKVFSMQTLANFAKEDKTLRSKIIKIIENLMKKGSPAIVGRGKKLINKLKKS